MFLCGVCNCPRDYDFGFFPAFGFAFGFDFATMRAALSLSRADRASHRYDEFLAGIGDAMDLSDFAAARAAYEDARGVSVSTGAALPSLRQMSTQFAASAMGAQGLFTTFAAYFGGRTYLDQRISYGTRMIHEMTRRVSRLLREALFL